MEDTMCLHTKPDAFTLAMMWGWFIVGLSLIASSFYPFWSASAVLRPSNWWVEDAIGVMLALGAAMTLVAAGYGIAIAPAARLAGYQCRGIAVRPLASAPPIVMAYLLHTCEALTEPQERFARRVRSVT